MANEGQQVTDRRMRMEHSVLRHLRQLGPPALEIFWKGVERGFRDGIFLSGRASIDTAVAVFQVEVTEAKTVVVTKARFKVLPVSAVLTCRRRKYIDVHLVSIDLPGEAWDEMFSTITDYGVEKIKMVVSAFLEKCTHGGSLRQIVKSMGHMWIVSAKGGLYELIDLVHGVRLVLRQRRNTISITAAALALDWALTGSLWPLSRA